AESRDGAEKPFEIVKAMTDEIAQQTTAAFPRTRLPALEAQARGLVLDVPGHDHMTQTPERAAVQDLFGAAPRRQLGKIEVDNGRLPASACRSEERRVGKEC